jgi:hypothetical protein
MSFLSGLAEWILNFLNTILSDFLATLFSWIPTVW